ncbi:hypothetical protein CcaCcLH18_00210 [Colletotrichum camelliae]|nr:hypothetical protein CcaCcLH18_00210 [Colletotrichum camelliae]
MQSKRATPRSSRGSDRASSDPFPFPPVPSDFEYADQSFLPEPARQLTEQPPVSARTMPIDEYASVGGGLKLKGAKVGKPKKKKSKKDKTDLEKNLDDGTDGGTALVKRRSDQDDDDNEEDKKAKRTKRRSEDPDAEDGDHEEDEDGGSGGGRHKTEAERRYEERKRKRLLELAESSSSRPELLKTHKERVEELNTYLSKLSEHHDMPKIGPG